MNSKDWSYMEEENWVGKYPVCASNNQSPVNISTETVLKCNLLCKLANLYKPSRCKIINDNNKLIVLNYDSGSRIKFKNVLYSLEKISIHSPSLHTIDGTKYDMEICLYHSLGITKPNNSDNGIILSCLFKKGDHSGNLEKFINEFINEIPISSNSQEKIVNVSKDWSAEMILPKKKSFFLYEGSLPYPPCTEKYNWVVFEEVGTISETNLETFKYNISNNSRSIQSLGNRDIYYNSNVEIEEIKDMPDPNPKIKKKINKKVKYSKFKDDGIPKRISKIIKIISLIFAFSLLLIDSYFIVKWLYRYEIMQKILNSLAGKNILAGSGFSNTIFKINQKINRMNQT